MNVKNYSIKKKKRISKTNLLLSKLSSVIEKQFSDYKLLNAAFNKWKHVTFHRVSRHHKSKSKSKHKYKKVGMLALKAEVSKKTKLEKEILRRSGIRSPKKDRKSINEDEDYYNEDDENFEKQYIVEFKDNALIRTKKNSNTFVLDENKENLKSKVKHNKRQSGDQFKYYFPDTYSPIDTINPPQFFRHTLINNNGNLEDDLNNFNLNLQSKNSGIKKRKKSKNKQNKNNIKNIMDIKIRHEQNKEKQKKFLKEMEKQINFKIQKSSTLHNIMRNLLKKIVIKADKKWNSKIEFFDKWFNKTFNIPTIENGNNQIINYEDFYDDNKEIYDYNIKPSLIKNKFTNVNNFKTFMDTVPLSLKKNIASDISNSKDSFGNIPNQLRKIQKSNNENSELKYSYNSNNTNQKSNFTTYNDFNTSNKRKENNKINYSFTQPKLGDTYLRNRSIIYSKQDINPDVTDIVIKQEEETEAEKMKNLKKKYKYAMHLLRKVIRSFKKRHRIIFQEDENLKNALKIWYNLVNSRNRQNEKNKININNVENNSDEDEDGIKIIYDNEEPDIENGNENIFQNNENIFNDKKNNLLKSSSKTNNDYGNKIDFISYSTEISYKKFNTIKDKMPQNSKKLYFDKNDLYSEQSIVKEDSNNNKFFKNIDISPINGKKQGERKKDSFKGKFATNKSNNHLINSFEKKMFFNFNSDNDYIDYNNKNIKNSSYKLNSLKNIYSKTSKNLQNKSKITQKKPKNFKLRNLIEDMDDKNMVIKSFDKWYDDTFDDDKNFKKNEDLQNDEVEITIHKRNELPQEYKKIENNSTKSFDKYEDIAKNTDNSYSNYNKNKHKDSDKKLRFVIKSTKNVNNNKLEIKDDTEKEEIYYFSGNSKTFAYNEIKKQTLIGNTLHNNVLKLLKNSRIEIKNKISMNNYLAILENQNKLIAAYQLYYLYFSYNDDYDFYLLRYAFNKWFKTKQIFRTPINNEKHIKSIKKFKNHCLKCKCINNDHCPGCKCLEQHEQCFDCNCEKILYLLKKLVIRHRLLKKMNKKRFYLYIWYKKTFRKTRDIYVLKEKK